MTLKQSLKSPENGDKLHQYVIVFNLPANWFSPNLPPIVTSSTLFTTENSIWLNATWRIFWLEDMKQGQYPFRHQLLWRKALPQSPGTSLLRRVEASGPAEGYRSGAPLCGFIFAQRNCQLRGAACKVSCPLRCEPCQGSKPAGAPPPAPRQPHAWCWPVCLLCTFSSHLGLPFKTADFLTGRDALSRAQAWTIQTGYSSGLTTLELGLKNALLWFVFHLPFTGTWGVGGLGGRLQARNCKDPILLYVKYIKIELAKKKKISVE